MDKNEEDGPARARGNGRAALAGVASDVPTRPIVTAVTPSEPFIRNAIKESIAALLTGLLGTVQIGTNAPVPNTIRIV